MAKKIAKKEASQMPKEKWLEVNESTKIRVGINEFKGVYRLDVREYVETEKYTGFTKKGVSVVTEQAEALMLAIAEIVATIKYENLYNEKEEEE